MSSRLSLLLKHVSGTPALQLSSNTSRNMATTFNIPTFPLNNGTAIPIIGYGLGTARYKATPGDLDQDTISYTTLAIKTGLHHLDGAEVYGNEEEQGLGTEKAGVDRSQLFITTKILPSIGNPAEAIKTSLKKLKTDYLDLYLIHAPFWNEKEKGITIEEAWLELEKLEKAGLTKAIGVSNFKIEELERILKVATIKPAVHQIEYSAYLQQTALIDFHKKHGIVTEAYHPLAPIISAKGGPLDPVIGKLTKKYGKTDTQILLRWVVEQGIVALTTSSKESRIKEALSVVEFKLDQEDIDEITKVGQQKYFRKYWDGKFPKEEP